MLFLFRVIFTLMVFSSVAFAQRGSQPSSRWREVPLSGFPGAFDSFQPGKGDYVVSGTMAVGGSVPVIGLPFEYGVTENFSVGSNLFVPILWSVGAKAFGGKIRYSAPLSQDFGFTFSGWGYMANVPGARIESQSIALNAGLATATASYFFSSRLWAHLLIGRAEAVFSQGAENSDAYTKTTLHSSFVGVNGEYMLASWFGFRAATFIPLSIETSSDGGSQSDATLGSISLKSGTNGNDLMMTTLMFDFLPGSHWLISPGVTASNQDASSGLILDVSYRW